MWVQNYYLLDYYLLDYYLLDYYLLDYYLVDYYLVEYYLVDYYLVDHHCLIIECSRMQDAGSRDHDDHFDIAQAVVQLLFFDLPERQNSNFASELGTDS
jgi:hypothetical protein